ncbi:CBN-GGR-2 protein [Aphelenchoides avenae]|nr:CBN-GGR-2 protein [Aphelenchus avenae]
MVVICAMQLQNFPLDSQWCHLRILSYAYDEDQLTIAWTPNDPITKNADIAISDMHIVKLIPGLCDGNYSTGIWSCVTAEFFVSREITHHILQTYVPTTLIVVISWFSFWLDVEAVPARVSLAITTLLTLSTQANSVRTSLPEVSYMKFVFGVMIEFTVVNYSQRNATIAATGEMPGTKKRNRLRDHRDAIGKQARNFIGRFVRTNTEVHNLIECNDEPNGPEEFVLPERTGARIPSGHSLDDGASVFTGEAESAADGASVDQVSWASFSRNKGTILSQENGEPKAVIHQRKTEGPKRWGERGAERLANWSRPELSCEGLVENLGSGWARVKPVPSTATTESSTGGLSKKLAGLSGANWTRAVRKIQHNKSVYSWFNLSLQRVYLW